MKIISIPLEKLIPHPANANVMSTEFLDKLRRQIAAQNRYEPLVVRPHPVRFDCFQILNGHHRKQVLEQLRHTHAHCLVWDVSDEQALMLLATLNRLCGQDDLLKRAALLDKLSRRFPQDELLKHLPERPDQLQRLLQLNLPPAPVEPKDLSEIPQAMIFFVTKEQRRTIDQALQLVKNKPSHETTEKKLTRAQLLCRLAQTALKEEQTC